MPEKNLAERVSNLENYFKIGLAVAAIMGVSGGFIGKTAYDALSAASEAQKTAESARVTVEQARDKAVQAVHEAGEKAVAAAVAKDVPAAVTSQFSQLSSRIRLALGDEQQTEYKPLSISFDHKCPAGSVGVGWGYGHLHNDAKFFCRPIQITVTGP